jgi:hypothetical protein
MAPKTSRDARRKAELAELTERAAYTTRVLNIFVVAGATVLMREHGFTTEQNATWMKATIEEIRTNLGISDGPTAANAPDHN